MLPLRNSANMPASRLPAPNGPDFTRLAPLFLKDENGSKIFYELLRPISNHTELKTKQFHKNFACVNKHAFIYNVKY